MIDWLIALPIVAYCLYVLVRFWKKSKKGSCAGCSIQSDGQTPSDCPGCSSSLSEEALQAVRNRQPKI